MTPRLSIVIPALDEGDALPRLLRELQVWRAAGSEVVVADGGSRDGTLDVAQRLADRVITTTPGRAHQMNTGARASGGPWLWFLHADSRAPRQAPARIEWALTRRHWGRFDVALSGSARPLRVIAMAMNRRSCWSGICTGDQGLFMTRAAFERVGGFPEQPLMEDVEISRRLKRLVGRPACVPGPLVTSSRRWERDGIVRTVMLMWALRLAYALGASPEALYRRYYGGLSADRGGTHDG